MNEAASALETYLAGVDPGAAPVVRALDAAVRGAHSSFDVAVKYRLLTYALGGDWRHWVCAIDAHPKRGVGLRFLYGVLLDDPRHVLRPGSSVLMTWDFAPGEAVDPEAVRAYVAEAVRRYPEYRANTAQVLEKSRAAAADRGAKRRG